MIRQSYLDTSEDLKAYANKVAYFNAMKKKVRSQVAHYRRTLANKPPTAKISMRLLTIEPVYRPGGKPVVLAARATKTVGEWESILDKWDEELQTVGDDAQLANIDLQNKLQQQQQTLQTISNVSKMLHDTAMAIIRKIG